MCCLQALYLGGFDSINKLLRLGKVQTDEAQVLVGCSAWTAGQLHDEVRAGCWYVLAASSSFLQECIFGKLCSI